MSLGKKLQLTALTSLSVLFFVSPAFAAAPDGLGPWADTVLSSHQGLMKNGLPVPAARSNPNSALGVAEDDTVDGHFFSLGFGGNIALGFDNGISNGSMIVEATNPNYPAETAKVEMSEDGVHWVMAGNVVQDGTVSKPKQLTCAKYVRITDTSIAANFPDAIADGYDVDGVKATGDPCTPPPNTGNCTTIVNQNNTTTTTNTVYNSANTGNNTSTGNTGGSNSVTSGNANAIVGIQTTGSSNTNNNTGSCCTTSTSVNVIGNGAGSKNTVIINQGLKNGKKPQGT